MQAIRSDLGTITETIKKSLGATNRIDLLLDKLTEADALVEDMTESSSAAVIVLNDLITYDKIENRTLIIEAKQVSPITLLTSTIRSLQVQAKHSQVKLEFVSEFHEESDEIVQREMSIIGDHVKLDQVIRNVVLNALKFSSSGDIVQVIGKQLLYSCCNLA